MPTTLSPAVQKMAANAHVSDGVACVQVLDGCGPADVYEALAARTGSRGWSIVGLRAGLARFAAA